MTSTDDPEGPRHPNLFCALSDRYPPVTRPNLASREIFGSRGPDPDRLRLIEDFPDRFMIGTDSGRTYNQAIAVVRRGLLP
ncbi:MAG: hypothetical protein ACE5KF_09410 [Kiloniellaceae bacterium]